MQTRRTGSEDEADCQELDVRPEDMPNVYWAY